MHKTLFPDAFTWLCGRCATWNAIENGLCSHCKAMSQAAASAFRVRNVLTATEQVFYTHTAVRIADDLGSIAKNTQEIRNILDSMRRKHE